MMLGHLKANKVNVSFFLYIYINIYIYIYIYEQLINRLVEIITYFCLLYQGYPIASQKCRHSLCRQFYCLVFFSWSCGFHLVNITDRLPVISDWQAYAHLATGYKTPRWEYQSDSAFRRMLRISQHLGCFLFSSQRPRSRRTIITLKGSQRDTD